MQKQAQALLLLLDMDNPAQAKGFTKYQQDPYAFCTEQLGESYTDDVKKVMESVRDNTTTIVRSANAVGKSHAAARIALWFYKCFPGAQVYTTAAPPEKNLKKIMWGEIGTLVRRHPKLFDGDRVFADMNIQRTEQEFITGVSIPMSGTAEEREAKFSGKHAPYLLFIVDEGDAVPEEVYKGIESCMSGGMARLLVLFNPRGEYGPVARMEKNKAGHVCQLSAITHPNVVEGRDIFPGAVTREATVRRINEWSRPLAPGENKDVECFEVPPYLVGTTALSLDGTTFAPLPNSLRKVTNPAFFYMVLGLYPPQSEKQLISRALIDAAVSRWLTYVAVHGEVPPVRDGVAGLDVAESAIGDWNVLCKRFGGFVSRLDERWKGIDPDATAIKATEKIKALQNQMVVNVDGTGLGSGVAPRMRRSGIQKAHSIKVASSPTYQTEMGTFFQLRDQLWWSTMLWLRDDKGAMLPPDEELADELSTPLWWVGLDGKVRVSDKETLREMLGRSPDKADALNLTFAPEPVMRIAPTVTTGNYVR